MLEPAREMWSEWRTPRALRPLAAEDEQLHPASTADPYWTETCWFTFTVPERRLSGQLYPFFRANQGVAAGGAYFWDEMGNEPWNCSYAKNFWHLPIPDQPIH